MPRTERQCDQASAPRPAEAHPELARPETEIFAAAAEAESLDHLYPATLAPLANHWQARYVAVAEFAAGRWLSVAEIGAAQSLPVDLLSDCLDHEQPEMRRPWLATPLGIRPGVAEMLVVQASGQLAPEEFLEQAAAIAPLVAWAVDRVARRQTELRQSRRRVERLEAILDIAHRWNQHHEMEPLLVEMAEAATRLIDADRASIFLWDKPNKTLVARPALGVEGGQLRIPDDAGVVGRVVHGSGAQRVVAEEEPGSVDRNVDQKLGYQTKTLLCVPLHASSGEMLGAFELINKHSGHFTAEDEAALTELAAHAATALENTQDRETLLSANRQITEQAAQEVQLIGESPAMQTMRSITQRVANTDLAVLILGENGTGKEVVARAIHYWSGRRENPFIAVNCAAIPDTLAESELFGHEKGAFTDAHEARAGKFELAAAGTLFLDEIGDLSLSGQAKLLRVLEEKVLVRVGGSTPIHTDARVVAATNQNLAEMVRNKDFREDLYFRLNVVTIELPPLRERPDDVLLLAEHFLTDFCRKARRKVPKMTAEARKRLLSHSWPGNVRELRNLMERLAYLSAEDRIEAEDLAFILSPRGQEKAPAIAADQTLADATAHFQEEYIRQAIDSCSGNVSQAASQLGLHRSNLYRKMRQLGMETP
jgi:Nif-specific regulatory protein